MKNQTESKSLTFTSNNNTLIVSSGVICYIIDKLADNATFFASLVDYQKSDTGFTATIKPYANMQSSKPTVVEINVTFIDNVWEFEYATELSAFHHTYFNHTIEGNNITLNLPTTNDKIDHFVFSDDNIDTKLKINFNDLNDMIIALTEKTKNDNISNILAEQYGWHLAITYASNGDTEYVDVTVSFRESIGWLLTNEDNDHQIII